MKFSWMGIKESVPKQLTILLAKGSTPPFVVVKLFTVQHRQGRMRGKQSILPRRRCPPFSKEEAGDSRAPFRTCPITPAFSHIRNCVSLATTFLLLLLSYHLWRWTCPRTKSALHSFREEQRTTTRRHDVTYTQHKSTLKRASAIHSITKETVSYRWTKEPPPVGTSPCTNKVGRSLQRNQPGNPPIRNPWYVLHLDRLIP